MVDIMDRFVQRRDRLSPVPEIFRRSCLHPRNQLSVSGDVSRSGDLICLR